MPGKIWARVPDFGAGNWKCPTSKPSNASKRIYSTSVSAGTIVSKQWKLSNICFIWLIKRYLLLTFWKVTLAIYLTVSISQRFVATNGATTNTVDHVHCKIGLQCMLGYLRACDTVYLAGLCFFSILHTQVLGVRMALIPYVSTHSLTTMASSTIHG